MWSPAGVKVLGTPIGTDEFVASQVAERLEDERRLWDALFEAHDLQCARIFFFYCERKPLQVPSILQPSHGACVRERV